MRSSNLFDLPELFSLNLSRFFTVQLSMFFVVVFATAILDYHILSNLSTTFFIFLLSLFFRTASNFDILAQPFLIVKVFLFFYKTNKIMFTTCVLYCYRFQNSPTQCGFQNSLITLTHSSLFVNNFLVLHKRTEKEGFEHSRRSPDLYP